MVDDIEQGSLNRYRDGIVAHLRAHRTANGSAITPTTLRQAVDAAMRHSLGAEHDGENSAPKVDPLLDDALPATMSYSGGLALDGDTVTFVVAFDWAALLKSKSGEFDETQTGDDFAKREWHAEVEWVFDRIDQPRRGAEVGMGALVSDVVRTRHDSSDIHVAHQLSLDRSESEGTWLVHAFVRTSHMPLIRVSTQLQVKSEGKRMQELRSQALGDMAHPDLLERDDDRFSGPLAFAPRTDTERAAARELDVEHLENVRDYLRQHADGRNADAIAAIEKQIERRREQDKKIKGDAGDGWRTFDVRATYLSKVDEVPSGALDIYGAFKVEEVASGVRLPTVMLRDLSRRFEQTEYTFKGHGATFEDALRDATRLREFHPSV